MRSKGKAIRLWQSAFLITAAVAGGASADDQPDVFKGSIGQAAVVMSLYPKDAAGTYFYDKYRRDIILHGTVKGNQYQLLEGLFNDAADAGNRMELRRDGARLTGTYLTAKGKALPVTLVRVPPGSVPEPRPAMRWAADESGRSAAERDYDRLRLNGLELTPQKPQTIGGHYVIQWYLEPRSGERLFRLAAGWSQSAMTAINTQLEIAQFRSAMDNLACAGGGKTPDAITFTLVNDRFLSYQSALSWDCEGAAHPDSGVASTTFDTRGGKELTLEDLWWLGKGAKPKANSDELYAYRQHVFAPAVVRLLSQSHPQAMRKPANEDDCDYSDPGVWELVGYGLSEQGLQLRPSFSHVQHECEDVDWAVIPYSALKKANPALFGQGAP